MFRTGLFHTACLEDEDEWNEKHLLVFGKLYHTTTISEIVKSQRLRENVQCTLHFAMHLVSDPGISGVKVE